jgi:hypothetical protein
LNFHAFSRFCQSRLHNHIKWLRRISNGCCYALTTRSLYGKPTGTLEFSPECEFLQVKRKNMGCKIFSREAGNVTSRHSFKFSGLANTKVPFAAFGGWQV